MKKLLTIILSATLILSTTACGFNSELEALKKENEKQTKKIKEEKKSVDYYSLINKRWQSEEERQKERESWARRDGKS